MLVQKTVLLYGEKQKHRNYVAALQRTGVQVTIELNEAGGCHGLLLPGGGDIYGTLAEEEHLLIQSFAQTGRPILGICRGMQALNVFFGGTLYEHIPCHQLSQGDLLHTVRSCGLFARLMGREAVVNSNHHQAVKHLAAGLEVLQWAQDGIIEGICHRQLPIWGTQWHPERQSFGMRRDTADAAPVFYLFCRQMVGMKGGTP